VIIFAVIEWAFFHAGGGDELDLAKLETHTKDDEQATQAEDFDETCIDVLNHPEPLRMHHRSSLLHLGMEAQIWSCSASSCGYSMSTVTGWSISTSSDN